MLTQDRLKEILRYDPETGLWEWLIWKTGVRKGRPAGYVSKPGYLVLRIDGIAYLGHRLAWFYMMGEWPDEIDHINLLKGDDRWVNLRAADHSKNMGNLALRRDNTTGFKGVSRIKNGKFVASIHEDGVSKHLGCFLLPEEAHAAYVEAATTRWGEFARAA